MSQATLQFFESVWERAEALADLGHVGRAYSILTRLASAARAPRRIRAAALRALARLELEQLHYARARRFLQAALALEPGDAYTAFLLGLTYEWQDNPALDRAYHYYRLATSWDPREPLFRAACHCVRLELFSSAAVRKDALRELDQCFSEDPDSPEVAYYYLRGLRAAGRTNAARWLVALCRRRWPGMPEFRDFNLHHSPEKAAASELALAKDRAQSPRRRRGSRRARILRFPSPSVAPARRAAR